MSTLRIGQGFDVHQLVEGRPLIIGGITIPHEKGLLGHSDDIGKHFSDTDPRYKNIDSRILLRNVYRLLTDKSYKIVNIDATIIAQSPKMAPHIPSMIATIAQDLEMPADCINLKAKTAEHLGAVGRKEGIVAEAVCLIERTIA